MPRMSKEAKLKNIHEEAMINYGRIQTALKQEREQCLEDRRFYSISGAQWEGSLEKQFEKKPKYEINKTHLAVIRIINEYRANRITVDFNSKDGSTDDKLSDICQGLFRADEQDSKAQEAYDNAFEEAVGGGYGALRLTTEYEDEEDDENENQRIRIIPIYDADTSVYFDLDSKYQDKSDANFCYVVTSMTPQAYKDKFDEDGESVQKLIDDSEYDWYTPDVILVAEYYKVESVSETIRIFETVDGQEERYNDDDFEADPKLEDLLYSTGSREVRTKKVNKKKVHKYILSGNKVIEDCGIIAGKCIPVVPTYGKRWFIDNVERCMGHVRLAKDSQRLKNMQMSRLAEISSLSPVEKPIFTPEQMKGHQLAWAEDNVKNYPFQLINSITDKEGNKQPVGALGYTKPPQIPPAMAALLQITDADMKEVLGNQEEADKMLSNISGKAVAMIQSRIDGQAFIYMSNFAKCIKRVGEVWLSMAKEVYVEPGRKMKTIGSQSEMGTAELIKPNINADGERVVDNDISKATFDVSVDVGASSTSKRNATVKSLTEMLQYTTDPQTSKVIQSLIMLNMEGEGLTDVKEYFRKDLVSMGALEPTEEEKQAMQANAEPNEQQKLMEAMAEEANAKAAKARVDNMKTLAEVEETKAQTEKIYSDINKQSIELVSQVIGQ